jgi:hypothetical protein
MLLVACLALSLVVTKEKLPGWRAWSMLSQAFCAFALAVVQADSSQLPLLFALPNACTAACLCAAVWRAGLMAPKEPAFLLWISLVVLGSAAAVVYTRTESVCDSYPERARDLWLGHGFFHLCAYGGSVCGFALYALLYRMKPGL